MRICKKIKDMMPDVLNNAGELSETEREGFHAHLENCERCSGEYKRVAGTLAVMNKRRRPEMSDDFWDNYYSRLEDKLDAAEEKAEEKTTPVTVKSPGWGEWFRGFKVQWVLYPAAAAAVVVTAVGVARFLSAPGGQRFVSTAVSSIRQLSPAVANHFDNVQPLLVDYSNYTPEEEPEEPGETVMVGKSTIQKLLMENRMLKQVVAKSDDITAGQLIEELEIILLELKNANGDSKETMKAVQRLIKDNDILFKMKALQMQKQKGKSSRI